MNWIDVKEKQPEEFQEVAFIVDSEDPHYNGRKMGGRYQGIKGTGERSYYEFTTPGIGWSGTHWMPLPDLSAPASQGDEAVGYIDELLKDVSELKDGWMELGSISPTQEVMQNTIGFLRLIPIQFVKMLDSDNISAFSHGTVSVRWTFNDNYIDVEIGSTTANYHGQIDEAYISNKSVSPIVLANMVADVLQQHFTITKKTT